jgi:pimeloyl-ACP methyl ester carboxylesterase
LPTEVTRIRHGRIELALYGRPADAGPTLLLMHALHDSSAAAVDAVAWPGPVHALDFAGHGASDWLHGGGYTPELFAADADMALAHLGQAANRVCLAGAGVGAYAALLLAGARPDVIVGALLAPGEGLGSGAGEPDFDRRPVRWAPLDVAGRDADSDPALARLNDEFKPREYVQAFAERARRLILLESAEVPARPRPGWWDVARAQPGAEIVGPDFETGLAALARHARLDK